METEETHDYVRASDMIHEESEEISFVPSAVSVPQKPLFRCDNQCSEKTLCFWQFASVDKGGLGFIHVQIMPAMLQRFTGGKKERNH